MKIFYSQALNCWHQFNDSAEPRRSWFRFTGLSRIIAILAVFEIVFLVPASWAYTLTYDVGLNPQMVTLLNLTGQILSQETQTQTNTTTMRMIKTNRQTISYALAQLQSLGDFGKLLVDNPLTDMVGAVQQFVNDVGSIRASNPAFASYINRQPSFNDLRFNGVSFQGQNGSFIDNVAGYNGLPVSADRQVPKMIFSIPDEASQLLRGVYQIHDVASELQSLGNSFQHLFSANSSGISGSLLADGIFIRQAQPLDNLYVAKVQRGSSRMNMEFYGLTDGLNQFGLRYDPITGVRPLKAAIPQKFDPTNALSSGAWAAIDRFNKDQIASGLAPLANPYDLYAYKITPALLSTVQGFKPGYRMEIPSDIIDRALKMGPKYDTRVSDATNSARALDTVVPKRLAQRFRVHDGLRTVQYTPASSGQQIYQGTQVGPQPQTDTYNQNAYLNGINVNPADVPSEYRRRQVAVVVPSLRQCESYINQITGNDIRLSQNLSLTGITAKMMEFVNMIVKALSLMREALQLLRQGASYLGALEGVTETLSIIDKTLSDMQHQIYNYADRVNGFLNQRHQILTDRYGIVTSAQDALRRSAEDRLFGQTIRGYENALQNYHVGS